MRPQTAGIALAAFAVGAAIAPVREFIEPTSWTVSAEATTAVDEASAHTEEFTYGVRFPVPWRDLDGNWHDDDSRPACLPPHVTAPIRLHAVKAENEDRQWRAVLWIECLPTPP